MPLSSTGHAAFTAVDAADGALAGDLRVDIAVSILPQVAFGTVLSE